MQFNLKKILKALLFSSSQALSIKDIQAVLTKYHKQMEKDAAADAAEEGAVATAPALDPVDAAINPEPDEAGEPVAASEPQGVLSDLMAQVPTLLTASQIREAMDELAQEFIDSGDVVRLLAGPAGFRLATAAEYAPWVRLLRDAPRPLRLSQAALETVSIIAYRQPVTRAEMESVRGVSVDSAINTLLEHELIAVTGRADLPGRPIQYGTTEKFLELCGLRSADELPASDVISSAQLNEWIRQATQPDTQARLLDDSDMGLSDEQESFVGEPPPADPLVEAAETEMTDDETPQEAVEEETQAE